ncbi:MAG: aminoacyl-tRNA hydrolase [Phycisphaerae bacterium]|nr:aminoacyl-tRNA hydrolase [Phycisphaerae bacterium]
MNDIRLIAGLGNPGREYCRTRHNVGFETIDLLAGKLEVELNKEKFDACFGQTIFEDKKLILLKPMLFMNNSGRVIADVSNFYKIEPANILVITDDLAIDTGMIRLRPSGSAGSHNGLADIVEKLATDKFGRLRLGIGSKGQMTGRDFVLSRPDPAQRELLEKAISEAAEAVMVWIRQGIEAAMNRFNKKMSPSENGGSKENTKDKD